MNYLLTFHTEEGKDLVFLTVTGAQHNGYFSTLQSSHRDIYIYILQGEDIHGVATLHVIISPS